MTRALVSVCALGLVLLVTGCADDRCCAVDADCGAGAACFEGMCAQRCTLDAQCLEGQKCTGAVCVDPLRAQSACDFVDAETPWALPDGGAAAEDGGTVLPSCTDALEPNDDVDTAYRLFVPGDFPPEGAELCPGDEDWYAINVNAGQELTALLLFDANAADLDLEILSYTSFAELDVNAASRGVTGVEEASVRPERAGVYYVRVYAFDDASVRYDLELSLSIDQPMCSDDGLEDNDGPYFASELSSGVTEALICPFDVDVYRFDVEPGASVVVNMTEPSPQLAPQMWGFSPQWGAVWAGLSYSSALPGEHYVVVAPLEGIASNMGWPYALTRIDAPAADCPEDFDDGNEPNDDFESATLIDLPASVFGVACESSPDYYRVPWPVGERDFDVEVDASLQVAVFEGERLIRATGQGTGWLEFAEPSGDTDEFYVVVTAPPGWGGPYFLEVW